MLHECCCMRGSLSASMKTSGKQEKSLMTSVTSNHRIVLRMGFVLLSGIADWNEFTSAFVIHVPLWETCFCYMQLVFMIDCILYCGDTI